MTTTTLTIQTIQPGHVRSVYAGKARKCCCGCSGAHHYAAAHAEEAGKNRGYPVGAEDINDAEVVRVLRTVQAAEADVEFDGPGHLSVEIGKRLYMVVLVDGYVVQAPGAVQVAS